jgi:hypothetical protein
VNKVAAIANATIKGVEAVQSAYAFGSSFAGPIGGAALAGVAIAATAANIQKIASTSFGGGGGTGSAGGGGNIPSQATSTGVPVTETAQPQSLEQQQSQTVVYVQGVISQDQLVNDIVPSALQNKVLNEDFQIVPARSRNAAELMDGV